MKRVDLQVEPRPIKVNDKKQNLNQLRAQGVIPGVVYGHGEAVAISISQKGFLKAIQGDGGVHALFNIKLGDQTTLGIVKEVQKHLTKRYPIHIDFKRVDSNEKLDVTSVVHTVGEAPGVKNSGGILELITREIRVRCLPDDIPSAINVDVSQLELGRAIKVKDLPVIKGVEFMTSGETIIVNVVAPKAEEVAAPADAAAAAAQPEVITKGKKEEEGAAPAAGGKAAASAPAAKPKDDKKK